MSAYRPNGPLTKAGGKAGLADYCVEIHNPESTRASGMWSIQVCCLRLEQSVSRLGLRLIHCFSRPVTRGPSFCRRVMPLRSVWAE